MTAFMLSKVGPLIHVADSDTLKRKQTGLEWKVKSEMTDCYNLLLYTGDDRRHSPGDTEQASDCIKGSCRRQF